MKIRIEKQDLTAALQVAKSALSSHNANPVLDGILFCAEDGALRLVASDSTLQATKSVPAAIDRPGSVVLPGQLFARIASNLPNEAIDISIDDPEKHSVLLVSGTFRMNLQGLHADQYPEMLPPEDGAKISLPQSTLKDMLSQTVFSVSKDQSRPILTGVLFELEDGELRLVALSANRMAIRREKVNAPDSAQAVIAESSLRKIIGMLSDSDEEPVNIVLGKNAAHFEIGSTRIHCMYLAGEFLKYRNIMPQDQTSTVIVDREMLLRALLRASSLSQETDKKFVRLSISADGIKLSASSEIGYVDDMVPAELRGEALEIAFNATFLTDILSRVKDDNLLMQCKGSEVAGTFRPMDGDAFYYLVAPVRI